VALDTKSGGYKSITNLLPIADEKSSFPVQVNIKRKSRKSAGLSKKGVVERGKAYKPSKYPYAFAVEKVESGRDDTGMAAVWRTMSSFAGNFRQASRDTWREYKKEGTYGNRKTSKSSLLPKNEEKKMLQGITISIPAHSALQLRRSLTGEKREVVLGEKTLG